jgi:hypothetical protein
MWPSIIKAGSPGAVDEFKEASEFVPGKGAFDANVFPKTLPAIGKRARLLINSLRFNYCYLKVGLYYNLSSYCIICFQCRDSRDLPQHQFNLTFFHQRPSLSWKNAKLSRAGSVCLPNEAYSIFYNPETGIQVQNPVSHS